MKIWSALVFFLLTLLLIFVLCFITISTTSSTDSGEGEFGKVEEQRLRDYVLQLRTERSAVRATVMELEPVHVDPLNSGPYCHTDATRFDLENAVLMQELMAMKVGTYPDLLIFFYIILYTI